MDQDVVLGGSHVQGRDLKDAELPNGAKDGCQGGLGREVLISRGARSAIHC
jgi:hypothetical protein